MENSNPPSAAIIISRDAAFKLSFLPNISKRQFYVHSLIHSYGLLKKLKVISAQKATVNDILAFHSRDYVELLAKSSDNDQVLEEAGLGYDCPVLENMMDWCLTVAGSSLSAANQLLSGDLKTVINWNGGWHHAHRDTAAGFCYVNDIVLAIHRLQTRFKKILYIDLDVHHGDGVEEAFSATNRVATFSIHKYETGYFPGTGDVNDIGTGRGRYHSINVPLHEGVTDEMYRRIFTSLFPEIMSTFSPDCIVVQCGADSIVGDHLGGFNLTPKAISECLKDILSNNIPVLILGGGGYNLPNVARCWTKLTAGVVGVELDEDIPDEDHYFTEYGPDFQIEISPGCVRNKNSQEHIDNIISAIKQNINLMNSTTNNTS